MKQNKTPYHGRISRRAVMTTLVIFIVFAAVGFLLWMGGHDVTCAPNEKRAGQSSPRPP